jgi:F0F1-type ATP synthase membrane subunit a
VQWRDIFTDKITDGVTNRIISPVMPSLILNLWPVDWFSFLSPSFLLPYAFFPVTNSRHPPNFNTIQPSTTNSATTTLSLSVFVFWFKFYWGFSMSHGCGITSIVLLMLLYQEMGETKNSCLIISGKREWESSPGI